MIDALQSLRPVLTRMGSHWHARIGPRTLQHLGLEDELVAHSHEAPLHPVSVTLPVCGPHLPPGTAGVHPARGTAY